MSNAVGTPDGSVIGDETSVEVSFGAGVADRLDRAVDAEGFDDAAALVHEATCLYLDDVLDEDGAIECPHDDCDATFPTRRQMRGHLGSSDHALDVPDGDFWCGYCGYGPTTWRGVNSHHGSSSHDGDPIRLDEEPDHSDLVAPDDIPDHQNPDLLERLYREHDGNYTAMCREHEFDVSDSRVRHYLIEYDIHDVTPQRESENDVGEQPVYRDPEWLQERYDAADQNISEMYRRIEAEADVDVAYRTLVKNLKATGIHDPEESPGRSQAWEHRGDPDDRDSGDRDREDDQDVVDDDPNDQDIEPEGDLEVEDEPEDDPVADDHGAGRDETIRSVLEVDDPDDVESLADLSTPAWLDEGSFFAAADMADDVDGLAAALGWDSHDLDRLEVIVDLLDVDLESGTETERDPQA